MSADEILFDTEERMEKAVDVLKRSLAGIRTGRANPGLVDSIKVDVYGSPTPIKQVAAVGAPEPTQIVIRPYDPGVIKSIEKAIVASNLGLSPQSDGRIVRLNIPQLSTEVRKKMVSRINDLGEVVFNVWDDKLLSWNLWLWRGDEPSRLTADPVDNVTISMNDIGEIAWTRGDFPETDIWVMLLKPGHANSDGVINMHDFSRFVD